MKGITRIATRLMLVFMALVVSSTVFFSSPALAALIPLDAKDFEIEVLKSDKPVVLVEFTAVWNSQNRMIQPILKEIASDEIKVYQVDIDKNPDTAAKYGVKSIPTVLAFKGGKVSGTVVGVVPRDNFLALVK